jgi:hypothetical protein
MLSHFADDWLVKAKGSCESSPDPLVSESDAGTLAIACKDADAGEEGESIPGESAKALKGCLLLIDEGLSL